MMPQVQPKQGIAQESRGQQLSTMALVIGSGPKWQSGNGKTENGTSETGQVWGSCRMGARGSKAQGF